LFIFILAAATLLAYSNNFAAEFVYDDYLFIIDNPAVQSPSRPARFFLERESFSSGGYEVIYRPLAALSFAVNYQLSGHNPESYHAVNILWHMACGILLFVLMRFTFADAIFAFFVSLLFVLHPVQTEAVSWISGRGNPMFLSFLLLTLICYGKWLAESPHKGLYYALALIFSALSLLSKEMAVVIPVLMIVYDVSLNPPARREAWKKLLFGVMPFVGLSLVYILLRHLILGETKQIEYWGGSMSAALLTTSKGFISYIRLMFFPRSLTVEYIVPVADSILDARVLISLLVLAAVAAVCIVSYRRAPILCFGIAWFFVSLLPVSNIVPLRAIMNERFLYLPSIGFCCILASPIRREASIARRGVAYGAMAALLIVSLCYATLTFDRNKDWRTSFALWTASVATSPEGSTSQYNLGLELYNRGRYVEAIEHLRMACQLQKDFPLAHGVLGNAYIAIGDYNAAILEYEIGLQQAPEDERLRHNLAMAWFEKGKAHEERDEVPMAIRSFQNALQYEPDFKDATKAIRNLRSRTERNRTNEIGRNRQGTT